MRPRSALILLLVLSAVVRFGVPRTPPGLHIDEASNAWNAWCIGQTMFDEHKVMLPWLYTRAFNDNRSPMYLYLAAPFEMAMGPLAVRLPAELGGVAATLLLWQLVRKLAGERAGLIAGVLWALDPTFAQFTRFGHEASITPMLVLASLCLWQQAGLLWTTKTEATPAEALKHPLRWAFAAGAFSGLACYGYAAVRLYLPCFLAISYVVECWELWQSKRTIDFTAENTVSDTCQTALTPSVIRRWIAANLGFFLLFSPLVYAHLTDPAINERGRQSWTWEPFDSFPTIVFKLAARYVSHFDPRFLFITGTNSQLLSTLAPPPPFGALPWGWAAFVLAGIIAVAWRFKVSRLARLAGVALLVYPAGDVLNALGGPNVLRLLCGWWVFALLMTVAIEWIADAVTAATASQSRGLAASIVPTAIAVAVALPNIVVLLLRWGTGPGQEWQRGVDFQAACAVVQPLLPKYDAIIFTQRDTPYAYAQILCFLNYPPGQFLTEPTVRGEVIDTKRNAADLLVQAGKLHFLRAMNEQPAVIDQAVATGLAGKTLWILRPADEWRSPQDRVLQTIRLSDGSPSLLVIEHLRDASDRAGH